jgi:hypothetical protein
MVGNFSLLHYTSFGLEHSAFNHWISARQDIIGILNVNLLSFMVNYPAHLLVALFSNCVQTRLGSEIRC